MGSHAGFKLFALWIKAFHQPIGISSHCGLHSSTKDQYPGVQSRERLRDLRPEPFRRFWFLKRTVRFFFLICLTATAEPFVDCSFILSTTDWDSSTKFLSSGQMLTRFVGSYGTARRAGFAEWARPFATFWPRLIADIDTFAIRWRGSQLRFVQSSSSCFQLFNSCDHILRSSSLWDLRECVYSPPELPSLLGYPIWSWLLPCLAMQSGVP